MAIFGHQQAEEAVNRFGKVFRLFVAIYYNNQRTSCGLPQEDRIHSLRGSRQPGKGCVAAGADALQHVLESRVTAQVEEQVSNNRMNQGWLIIPSTILVVE